MRAGLPLASVSGVSVSVVSPSIAPPAGALIHVPAIGRDLPLLLDVPDAGRLAGLSRYASYRAAEDGRGVSATAGLLADLGVEVITAPTVVVPSHL